MTDLELKKKNCRCDCGDLQNIEVPQKMKTGKISIFKIEQKDRFQKLWNSKLDAGSRQFSQNIIQMAPRRCFQGVNRGTLIMGHNESAHFLS